MSPSGPGQPSGLTEGISMGTASGISTSRAGPHCPRSQPAWPPGSLMTGSTGRGPELGLEASVRSPCRHPQGHVSGAPHRHPGVCFPSCCQSLQGWRGERAGAHQIERQTQQKPAHLGLRGTGDEQKGPPRPGACPPAASAGLRGLACSLSRRPDSAQRDHRARAQFGTRRCCGRSLLQSDSFAKRVTFQTH